MPEPSVTSYNTHPPDPLSAVEDTALQPGEVLGGCVVEAFIARGGMGSVYRARKLSLRSTVALKVLQPSLLAHPKVLSRFLREARVAAALSHPAIVKVFDVGQERGLHYIVMEFIEGRDLRHAIKSDGPLKVKEALRVARRVAEALQYAHDRGVIHRDVKPANILLARDGQVKLTDMGLARPAQEDTEVTMAGEIIGTPVFMAPEQCRGDVRDGRCDLYSLGATLYMALTAIVPFQAQTTAALIHKVINDPPPSLEARAPHVPRETVAFVKRLMAKLPGARYQTGKEVIDAIDEILSGRRKGPAESRETRRGAKEEGPGILRLVGLGAVAVVLGIAAYFLSPGEASRALAPPGSRQGEGQGDRDLDGEVDARRGANVFFVGSASGEEARHTGSGDGAGVDGSATNWTGAVVQGGAINNPALKDRVDRFRDAVLAEDPDGMLALFPTDIRENPMLHVSLLDFLGKVRALAPRSVQYMASQRSPEEAVVTIVFHGADDDRPLGLPLTWVLMEGSWYVRPRLIEGGVER